MPNLFTRVTLVGCVAAIAGLGAAVLVARGPSIPSDTQATAKFLLATCGDSAHNLDAVAQRAERQHWTSMIHPGAGENDPLKVAGMWRVEQDGHAYIVTTGVGPGDDTACQVEFEHPKPGRDDFFAAVSAALTLNLAGDFPGGGWRTEMYLIGNLAPKNTVLLFVSSSDGAVYRGAVMGN